MIRHVVMLTAFLAGCTTVEKIPAELCAPLPKLTPHIPTPVVLGVPQFYVVSENNKETFQKRILKDSDGVFYAVTPDGYTILSENMQELRRYIRELQEVILYYDQNTTSESSVADSGDGPKQ